MATTTEKICMMKMLEKRSQHIIQFETVVLYIHITGLTNRRGESNKLGNNSNSNNSTKQTVQVISITTNPYKIFQRQQVKQHRKT